MKNRNKNKGFTLLELIISLAMVSIITGAVLQIARFSDTHKSLTLATDELRAVIRSAQSSSLSIPNPDARHVCGYGVNINSATTYELYYTYVETDVYRTDPNTCINDDSYRTFSGTVDGTTRNTMQSFVLRDNLNFDAGDVNQSIFFIAPYGEVFDNSGSLLEGSTMTFEIEKTGASRTVTINGYGRIE